jgi:hypothetical protein
VLVDELTGEVRRLRLRGGKQFVSARLGTHARRDLGRDVLRVDVRVVGLGRRAGSLLSLDLVLVGAENVVQPVDLVVRWRRRSGMIADSWRSDCST